MLIRTLLTALLTVSIIHVFSQTTVDPVTGNIASPNMYSIHGKAVTVTRDNIKGGSIFFNDDWMNSTIITKDGKEYKNIQARLNLLEKKVHYLNNTTEFVADSPIGDIILMNSDNKAKYHFVNYKDKKNALIPAEDEWYLSLHEGKISLYKLIDKSTEEVKGYGSAIADIYIKTNEKYFVLYKGELHNVSKIKQLSEILFDKGSEIDSYIKQLPKKSFESSLIDVVSYYNSLK